MEIVEFAEVTYKVLEETPLEDHIPTAIFPGRDHIMALEGILEEEEKRLREITLDWALKAAKGGEEVLVVFRDGPGYFRVIRRFEGKLQEALFPSWKQNSFRFEVRQK